MAYYLGRDVKVYLTTESAECQVDVSANTVTTTGAGAPADVAATGTVQFTNSAAADLDDSTITVISSDGTSIVYTLDDDTNTNTYTASTTNVGIQGTFGHPSKAAELFTTAVNHASNAHADKITASEGSSATVTLTQDVTGIAGNKTIATNDASDITVVSFTGGYDEPDFAAGTTFAENLDLSPSLTRIKDLTGVDLSIGVTDEDITFMSSKTVLKAEIKKETTISLTRKKSDNVWDVVYNGPTAASKGWTGSAAETGDYGARWGVIEGAADTWYINNGLVAPKNVTDFGGTGVSFGYRVFIELKGSTEIISIPGCQLTGHTIALNADGTTEETCELISHVTPLIGSTLGAVDTRLLAADM